MIKSRLFRTETPLESIIISKVIKSIMEEVKRDYEAKNN